LLIFWTLFEFNKLFMVMPHTVVPIVMFSFWLITKIKICIETIILFLTYVKWNMKLDYNIHTMNILFQFDFTMHNSLWPVYLIHIVWNCRLGTIIDIPIPPEKIIFLVFSFSFVDWQLEHVPNLSVIRLMLSRKGFR